MGGTYLSSFIPKGRSGGAGGETAKDALGNSVKASNLIIIFSHNASYTDISVMLYILACS